MARSSVQLAHLVRAYLAEPGASLEEKAARVGMRKNELLRAARGAISRMVRMRLLAFFARAGARRLSEARGPAGRHADRQRKRGFT